MVRSIGMRHRNRYLGRVVSQAYVQVWAGKGGFKPTPVPVVTMGMCVVPGGEDRMLVVEMTPGQTRHLIARLTEMLAPATPDKVECVGS